VKANCRLTGSAKTHPGLIRGDAIAANGNLEIPGLVLRTIRMRWPPPGQRQRAPSHLVDEGWGARSIGRPNPSTEIAL